MGNVENLKPFKPGNPGGPGRPKLTEEQRQARRLAKRLVGRAMARLEHWMDSNDSFASISAATKIIDRAEGKPAQAIEHSGPDGEAIPIRGVLTFVEPKRSA